MRALNAWVNEPERGWTGKVSTPSGIAGPNRDELTVGPALALIAEALVEPEPKVQPLQPRAAGAARVPPR